METPQDFIRHASAGHDLSGDQAAAAMNGIMSGAWSTAQIGAYLTALHIKRETRDEIVGSARVMREKAFSQPVQRRPLLDIVGSGGDGLQTINVSTLAGLVCAAAGVPVAKHGNRAMSGMCGAADILEGLGVALDIAPADAVRGVDQNGFGFLFAPHFHQSMKHAVAPRREIGIPTIFNYLGPLTNPVGAEFYLIGVNRRENARLFTDVLAGLDCPHSLVVHGADGMDEITVTGDTHVVEQKDGNIREYTLKPEEFGIASVEATRLTLPDKAAALRMARAFLAGEAPQEHEHLVLLNAAAGLYVAGQSASISAGLELARQTLRSGAARALLDQVARYTVDRATAAQRSEG